MARCLNRPSLLSFMLFFLVFLSSVPINKSEDHVGVEGKFQSDADIGSQVKSQTELYSVKQTLSSPSRPSSSKSLNLSNSIQESETDDSEGPADTSKILNKLSEIISKASSDFKGKDIHSLENVNDANSHRAQSEFGVLNTLAQSNANTRDSQLHSQSDIGVLNGLDDPLYSHSSEIHRQSSDIGVLNKLAYSAPTPRNGSSHDSQLQTQSDIGVLNGSDDPIPSHGSEILHQSLDIGVLNGLDDHIYSHGSKTHHQSSDIGVLNGLDNSIPSQSSQIHHQSQDIGVLNGLDDSIPSQGSQIHHQSSDIGVFNNLASPAVPDTNSDDLESEHTSVVENKLDSNNIATMDLPVRTGNDLNLSSDMTKFGMKLQNTDKSKSDKFGTLTNLVGIFDNQNFLSDNTEKPDSAFYNKEQSDEIDDEPSETVELDSVEVTLVPSPPEDNLRNIAEKIPADLSPGEREDLRQKLSDTLGLSAIEPGLAQLSQLKESQNLSPEPERSATSNLGFTSSSSLESSKFAYNNFAKVELEDDTFNFNKKNSLTDFEEWVTKPSDALSGERNNAVTDALDGSSPTTSSATISTSGFDRIIFEGNEDEEHQKQLKVKQNFGRKVLNENSTEDYYITDKENNKYEFDDNSFWGDFDKDEDDYIGGEVYASASPRPFQRDDLTDNVGISEESLTGLEGEGDTSQIGDEEFDYEEDDDNEWYNSPTNVGDIKDMYPLQESSSVPSVEMLQPVGNVPPGNEVLFDDDDTVSESKTQIGAPDFKEGVINKEDLHAKKALQAPKGTIILYTAVIVVLIACFVVFSIWKNPFKNGRPVHQTPVMRAGEEGKRLLDHPFV